MSVVLSPNDYANLADALETSAKYPRVDEHGRERCLISMAPEVLRALCVGLRSLSGKAAPITLEGKINGRQS